MNPSGGTGAAPGDRAPLVWRAGTKTFDLSRGAIVMGVLNATPDSFSDGGECPSPEAIAERGARMVADGAAILDVGGESTRPGATPVPVEEELRRVVPAIRALRRAGVEAAISIDTYKPEVARAALDAGADVVNDVTALRGMDGSGETARVVAERGAGAALMHMLGEPLAMQNDPRYGDVVAEVAAFLRERVEAAVAEGIPRENIAVDPGIGFGKTFEHNLAILRAVPAFAAIGRPVLIGASRKMFLRTILGVKSSRAPEDRDALADGTAAVCATCVAAGASIVRVHDVARVARAVRVANALRG